MKKFFCIMMIVIISLSSSIQCFAATPENVPPTTEQEIVIDADIAMALALLFVMNNNDNDMAWNFDTYVSDIIPFYDSSDNINAYCAFLMTNQEQSGYIIISTDLNANLIQEFSDHTLPLFCYSESNEQVASFNNKVYYTSPLQYGYEKPNIIDNIPYSNIQNTETHYESNYELVLSLREICKDISTTTNPTIRSIEWPYDYLQQLSPNYYHFVSSNCMYSFDGYIIEGRNACAVYAVAAVLHYHLKRIDGIDFESRASQCKKIAIDEGYADVVGDYINYYIELGKLQAFAKACIKHFGANLTQDSVLFYPWQNAVEDLDAGRPVIINIWKEPGSGYVDHSVVAHGWTLYEGQNNEQYRFYRVKDGYTKDDRYVDVEKISIYFITKIY